jgi:hypothetical protein
MQEFFMLRGSRVLTDPYMEIIVLQQERKHCLSESAKPSGKMTLQSDIATCSSRKELEKLHLVYFYYYKILWFSGYLFSE